MKFRSGFLILLFILLLFPVSAFASIWAITYGGSSDDLAYSIQQTSDGGFIVAGETRSFGIGSPNCWVLKLDANGNVIWQKTYSGSNHQRAKSIQETSDGGFIVVGYQEDVSDEPPLRDTWVLKLNSTGNVMWQKTYGGSSDDLAYSIQQTSDGGFIVAGETRSFGIGSPNCWVLKLDANGNVIWQKTYGGSNYDRAYSIRQTSDGGFIVAGYTESYGAGYEDYWILKLDSDGNIIWQKTYGGGSDYEGAESIQQTTDGGYVVAGYTMNYIASWDFWVLKLNSTGNVIWQKTYGGFGYDRAYSIQQTTDGGFIVIGQTYSYGAGISDAWVLKLNSTGNVMWQKTYGGHDYEQAQSIQQTSDGGFIVVGYQDVSGIEPSPSPLDYWVLKLDADGNIPDCDLIQDTSVVPANTNVIPATTGVNPVTTNATVTNTTVVPLNTNALVEEQCFFMEPSNLVYAPVTPCRIVDTRLSGYVFWPGTIQGFNVWGDVASQGGNPAGCPSPKGEPYTAHINVTVVPLGNGNIVAYPYGSTAPLASLVNYRADAQNIANSATVKTCFNCSKDINIKSNNSTAHVIIDVLGYDFAKP
jgi:uncharacterized delta-60 repeat protein